MKKIRPPGNFIFLKDIKKLIINNLYTFNIILYNITLPILKKNYLHPLINCLKGVFLNQMA